MKKLLFILLLSSGFAMANDNVKKTDEKAVESCTWCAKEGDETICATAETCKDAQKLLLEMAIAH